MATHDNWRWCSKCQGLWFAGNPNQGHCPINVGTMYQPVYTAHSFHNSGNYSLTLEDASSPGQRGWRLCSQCSGLFFSGNTTRGRCPTQVAHGGPLEHNLSQSLPYILVPGGPGQPGWRFCGQCQGLFFNGNGSLGHCPIARPGGGIATGQHAPYGADYSLVADYKPPRLATTPYVITWQTLQSSFLQDDCDQVSIRLEASRARAGFTEFFLQAAASVTFVKELKIITPGRPDRFIKTEGDQHGPIGELEVSAAEINVSTLVLSKGKMLNILTPMYHMNGLDEVAGRRVIFNWARDRCP